jgi:hypothetical protein
MELGLALLALLLAALSLGLTWRLRAELQGVQHLEQRQVSLQAELHELQGQLAALRSTVENPPPLSLPRRRGGQLEDLREQLRAAQEQPDADEQE